MEKKPFWKMNICGGYNLNVVAYSLHNNWWYNNAPVACAVDSEKIK